ncbi:MAG: amidase [Steroidobacteraceae bacterium]
MLRIMDSGDPKLDRRAVLGLAGGVAAGAVASSFMHTASAAARPSSIVMLDAVALADAIRSRQVSCVEVMSSYLDHIEKLNPRVNAIVALQDRAPLLAQSEERDGQVKRGELMGPLHGFPLAVKDLMPVKGIRMTMGSPILKDFVPHADGIMVERLRNAGAIFIGKTNTPEFGLGSHTYNPVYGPTRNAFDQSRSAGGSSGGAAVSLALRMLPVADGSDFGGSLRNPAGWNNVFGFRTTMGVVPGSEHDGWLPSMSVVGPMARNVPDLAMLLSIQAGYDARVPLSSMGDASVFQRRLESDLSGKRIAWSGDFRGYLPFEPGVLDVCKSALKVFESMGCRVEEAQPDYSIDSVWRAFLQLRAWLSGAGLMEYYNNPEKRALLKPEAIFEVESGLKLDAFDIAAASAVRTEWYQAVRRFFEQYDYFVVPTAQLFPFDVNLHWPQEIAGVKMHTYHEWMKCVLPVTMSGCPALAAPAGFGSGGLPIGIQIVGPIHAEVACLQLAFGYDTATSWSSKRLPALLGSAI